MYVGQLMGYRLMHRTLLLKYGIAIPRNHTMQLLKFKDPTGVLERQRRVLRRRTYTALGPSYLWHADGHDKLKRYGFPIHACIDGYSRRIIWIHCSTTNNDPKVIGYYYLTAVKQLGGCPHILRTDCGTENVLMATLQCTIRNTNRAHIYGTSQNNQRIESWWSYMSNMRTRWWVQFFDTMEQAGFLNTDNTDEIDCLRFSFMSILRCQLLEVQTLWNNHCIRYSRGARCPGGVPEHLFFTPRDALQCLVPLNGNVSDFFHLCTVPQICQNNELQASLKQYCDTMAISTPTNVDEGVQLFRLLKSVFV